MVAKHLDQYVCDHICHNFEACLDSCLTENYQEKHMGRFKSLKSLLLEVLRSVKPGTPEGSNENGNVSLERGGVLKTWMSSLVGYGYFLDPIHI